MGWAENEGDENPPDFFLLSESAVRLSVFTLASKSVNEKRNSK